MGLPGERVVMTTTRGTHAPARRTLIAVGIAGVAILAGATTADAAQFQKVEQYSGSFEEHFELCGLEIHHEVEFAGTFAIRSGKGDLSEAFYGRDNYSVTEVFTNVANGKWFTLTANGVVQDIKATLVEGDVVEFVTHEVGQPFVVTNMDGEVVLRDRGRIEFTYLFDTFGDGVPSGVPIEDLGVHIAGPHPGFFLDDAATCEGIVNLIGD